jgi:hypothetical protein
MAATFGALGVGAAGTGTRTPQIPANVDAGDLYLILQAISNGATRTGGVTGGNGTWGNELTSTGIGNGSLYCDVKVCTADEDEPPATYSVTGNAIQSQSVICLRIDGPDPADPVFGTPAAGSGATTAAAAVSLNSVPAGACLVWFYRCQGGSASMTTPPSGFTVRSPGGASTFHIATLDNFVGGNTGSLSATMSAGVAHRTMLVAVNPIVPKSGTFTGGYDFTGSGFAGAAGEGQGSLSGGYDFSGSNFVGVAGEPSAYGFFVGEYDFTGSNFVGADDEDNLIDVYGTEGGRRRFGGRK